MMMIIIKIITPGGPVACLNGNLIAYWSTGVDSWLVRFFIEENWYKICTEWVFVCFSVLCSRFVLFCHLRSPKHFSDCRPEVTLQLLLNAGQGWPSGCYRPQLLLTAGQDDPPVVSVILYVTRIYFRNTWNHHRRYKGDRTRNYCVQGICLSNVALNVATVRVVNLCL